MRPYEEEPFEPEDDERARRRGATPLFERSVTRWSAAFSEEWSRRPVAASRSEARETWAVIGESWRRRHGRRWGA